MIPSGHWRMSVVMELFLLGGHFKKNLKAAIGLEYWGKLINVILSCQLIANVNGWSQNIYSEFSLAIRTWTLIL